MNGAAGDSPAPARSWRQALAPSAIAVVFAFYPVVVWLGLAKQNPRTVAIVLLGVMLPVLVYLLRQARGATVALLLAPVATVVAIGAAAAFDDAAWLFVEPVAISAGLLLAFGSTLRSGGMPMVERFARMHEPDLAPDKQAWCRLWTWIWCAFFVANGTTATVLAAAAPLSWWAWYNGGLVYVVMGTLFSTEYLMRRRRFFRG